jgi:glycosyltransferase involved in cell wall biosynthesis
MSSKIKKDKPINIAIDGSALGITHDCGTKTYAQELIKAIQKNDHYNQYTLFVINEKSAEIITNKNFKYKVFQKWFFSSRLITHVSQTELSHFDIFHRLDPFGILSYQHPNTVTTIHDMGTDKVYFPLGADWHKALFINYGLSESIRKSKSYITCSNTVMNELLAKIGSSKKVVAIYEGSDHISNQAQVNKSDSQHAFIIFWDYPIRKNVRYITDCISRNLKNDSRDIKIILICSNKQKEYALRYIQSLESYEHFVIKVAPSLEELAHIYANATGLIYASLYEGFGLPIVEAMRCGCPVITTNYGAMREVAGDAAILIDPTNESELINAVELLTTNSQLRRRLTKKGFERAKKFVWNKTAISTINFYTSILK